MRERAETLARRASFSALSPPLSVTVETVEGRGGGGGHRCAGAKMNSDDVNLFLSHQSGAESEEDIKILMVTVQ